MIEFKHIIGRGTRTFDGRNSFTSRDFVKAHENFNDPDWDGEPLVPEPPLGSQHTVHDPYKEDEVPEPGTDEEPPKQKFVIKLSDGRKRSIQYIKTTTYWSADGKPISATEFMQQLFGDLSGLIKSEDQLRSTWSNSDNQEHFLTQLSDGGYDSDRLNDIRLLVNAPKSDLFDVLSYVLFINPPKTRQVRADVVRQGDLDVYEPEMKQLLLDILRAYEADGEAELATKKLGKFLTVKYGSVSEGKTKLGALASIKKAYIAIQVGLYAR